MHESRPKSPDLIQAQVAAFASEKVVDTTERTYLLDRLGELAVRDVELVTRQNEAGEAQTIATRQEYADFLRSVGGSSYEGISGRAEMLGAYGDFKPAIDKLTLELAGVSTHEDHPSFMGDGSNAAVFSIEHDGKKYAARIPHRKEGSAATIDSHLAGAVLAKDIPRLEHIVAASYEDGATIAEIMPGKEVSYLTAGEIHQVTDAQLEELVDTVVLAEQRGIVIDPKPSNVLYDPEAGYSIVDITSSKVADVDPSKNGIGGVLGQIAAPLNNAGVYRTDHAHEVTVESCAKDGELYAANLDVVKRYRKIVEAKLAGGDQEKALQEIDSTIASAQRAVNNYADPQWVAEHIAQHTAWKSEQEKLSQLSPEETWTNW